MKGRLNFKKISVIVVFLYLSSTTTTTTVAKLSKQCDIKDKIFEKKIIDNSIIFNLRRRNQQQQQQSLQNINNIQLYISNNPKVHSYVYKPSFMKYYITWHYIPKLSYKKYKNKINGLNYYSYRHAYKSIKFVFKHLNMLFPFIKFVETRKYSDANIKFRFYKNETLNENDAFIAHAHVGDPSSNADLHGSICFYPYFWEHMDEQYVTALHEVFHMLGLKDMPNDDEVTMMNTRGSYVLTMPHYNDILTITHNYYGEDYFKFVISPFEFEKILQQIAYDKKKL